MLKSISVSLAAWSSLPKTPLVVVVLVVDLISFFMPVLRLGILCVMYGVFGDDFVICGRVRRPLIGDPLLQR